MSLLPKYFHSECFSTRNVSLSSLILGAEKSQRKKLHSRLLINVTLKKFRSFWMFSMKVNEILLIGNVSSHKNISKPVRVSDSKQKIIRWAKIFVNLGYFLLPPLKYSFSWFHIRSMKLFHDRSWWSYVIIFAKMLDSNTWILYFSFPLVEFWVIHILL